MLNNQLKNWLKKFNLIVKIKHKIFSLFDGTSRLTILNVHRTFPLYIPYSGGNYNVRTRLTLEAINKIFPLLSSLANCAQNKKVTVENITKLSLHSQSKESAELLKQILDRHESDKANNHDYHHLYGAILKNPLSVENIFEIGLGTNNTDIISNMGIDGKPGASLRAFREYCPKAFIYGADVDKRILFEEERIKTFFVDQTNPFTFASLLTKIPNNFDLVIDDGLHSPHANLASLEFGLKIIKVGGWVVVEDISHAALDLWKVVTVLFSSNYEPHIFLAKRGLIFAVKRLQ
jgi:hypothetical protein